MHQIDFALVVLELNHLHSFQTQQCRDIVEFENYVNDLVQVPLKQNQFDALCSWVYNLGPANLKASTLLKVLNSGDYEGVPAQIKRWNKAGGNVNAGLVRRREAEAALWEGKEWIHI